MKNIFRISIILVLAIGLFAGVRPASAALTAYNSGFQVQNLEAGSAGITLYFYNRDGSNALTATDSIAGSGSNTYFPLDNIGGDPTKDVPAGFDGSVVIESTTKVAAITNVIGSDGGDPLAFGASYNGFTGGTSPVYIPVLMHGNFGYNTWFSVQNVGSNPTDVSVEYSDGQVGSATALAPGAAAKFDQATETHAAGWVGSAKVSAGENLAISVLEVGPTTLFAFDGASGAATLVFPLINQNNTGIVTGIPVQNLGTTTTRVTIDYIPGAPPLGAGTACNEVRDIPAGQSVPFALYSMTTFVEPAATASTLVSTTCTKGAKLVGSAKVTSNLAGNNLVAIVNQLNPAKNQGGAYNSFDPATATATVVFPLVMDRNYNYLTGINVYNAGGSTIPMANITCHIAGNLVPPSGPKVPVAKDYNPTADLGAGASWSLLQTDLGAYFVGSATCSAPAGSMLVGIANEVNLTKSKDTLSVYEGTNP